MSDEKDRPRGITLRRRHALGLGAAAAGALAAPAVWGQAAGFPNRQVRYINPFPAGGATDTLSRIYCQKMSELSGVQWIVENRGGMGGGVGVDVYAKAPPDGYTLGLGGIATHAISPTLYKSMPFDPRNDFVHISTLWHLPNLLTINNDLPAKTVPELIELLKKNPGKYSYASAGPGTTLHLSGELFKMLAKVDMLHVPYRGAAPGMQDLLAGQVHMIFDNIPGALAVVRPGKARGLAVTSAKRSDVVPDFPPISDFLPGFDISSWTTVSGPKGIPEPVVARLNELTKQALASPDLIERYRTMSTSTVWMTTADTMAYVKKEEERLRPIIIASGAKVD